jgi:NAD-dependent deacetylase
MPPFSSPQDRARAYLADARSVLVLTGAGVSAESGVPTFRGAGGLWKTHRAEELATPAAFARDPRLVWEWYAWRRTLVAACAPNAAHHALAAFAARPAGGVLLATQNVDGLHGRAAAALAASAGRRGRPVVELHGSLFRVRCTLCPYAGAHDEPVDASARETLPRCPDCGALLRPGVVWFGEPLEAPVLGAAMRAAERADVCLVVGTSALVQPAASLAAITREAGGRVIEVNPADTPLTPLADEVLRGVAGEVVPTIV